ncbi:sarcosine oxidase subunit gamma [Gordonia sp. HNM0687]|uniref:Sarcosine oxidase subunit gamma n=1 Tax=Gordonia mangrovi TaxID=2665643 RepID=A0A6L7GS11_9ACTN|nr:sarcosine oxidase subunit gamma family protein [Gordonia mangrovi]MXP21475.1 sarcosine oxidase subunit gamma [Gordonia mangrovi]UVF80220.1 sarcosine oxidase subunit gamma [Gordonia mangrovi]
MADITIPDLEPIGPLRDWSDRFAALAPAILLAETPVAQTVVRPTGPEAGKRLELPGVCQTAHTGQETALWLGPDEFLCYAADVAPHVLAATIGDRARDSAYVADVSGQRTRLVLGGPHAETILAHGCAIDLSPNAFGPDDVIQTQLAQAGVIMHRVPDGFAIFVRSSFADYLAGWLVDAATEYVATTP